MELDELAGRLDRLEKAHAATRLVLAELIRLLSNTCVVEDEDLDAFVLKIGERMMAASDEEVAAMREHVARLISVAQCGNESEWRHVQGRALEDGPGQDPIAALLPRNLR